MDTSQKTLVLGAGPAGLTAGYLLGKAGRDVVVLEAEAQVGGLAKTVEIDGYLDYPLRGPDVVRKLGPIELTRCVASYLRAAARRDKRDESLEDWVSNR